MKVKISFEHSLMFALFKSLHFSFWHAERIRTLMTRKESFKDSLSFPQPHNHVWHMLPSTTSQSSDSWQLAFACPDFREVFTFCDVIEYVQCHLAEEQSPWCQHPGLTSPCPRCERNAKPWQSIALKDFECSYYLSQRADFPIHTKGQLNQKITKAYLYCRATIWNSSAKLLKWVETAKHSLTSQCFLLLLGL